MEGMKVAGEAKVEGVNVEGIKVDVWSRVRVEGSEVQGAKVEEVEVKRVVAEGAKVAWSERWEWRWSE